MTVNRLENLESHRSVLRGHGLSEGAELLAEAGPLARHLAQKLTAPVGILNTRRWSWEAAAGAPVALFPEIDVALKEVASSGALRLGKVAIWRPGGEEQPTWLVMAMPSSGSNDWIAFAGFQPFGAAHVGPSRRGEFDLIPDSESNPAWGPACPEPALRAWGQQVVNRLESQCETRVFPVEAVSATAPDAESEHVVIGRLIRRMRISDSPSKFQALAANVLRTSLGMSAVAWVPSDPREPVVVSGELIGMRSSSYRSIIPSSPRDSAHVVNNAKEDSRCGAIQGLNRYVTVPAGSTGWLVAINPVTDRRIGGVDIERMQYVASLIATQLSNSESYAELKEMFFGTIRALTAAVDAKDTHTCGHSERVARIAVELAAEMGMAPQERSDLYLAGLLHDIGKIGVDDKVLKKDGPLTTEEYAAIQLHVQMGVEILEGIKKLSRILPAVRHHHESVDGSGYPDHLSGEEIPLKARIIAVADSFDAMSNDRPYRKRMASRQIDDVFRKGRGVQWDATVVDALFARRQEVEKIQRKGLGESLIGAVNMALGRG